MGLIDELNERRKKNNSTSEGTPKKSLTAELEERKKYQSINTDNVDQKYIDSFLKEASAFLTTAEEDYGGLGWGNAPSSYESRNTSWQALSTRADTVGAWLYKNRDRIGSDTYNDLYEYIDSFRSGGSSVLNSFKGAVDYYSQWETEDEYNKWYEAINSGKGEQGWQKYLADVEAANSASETPWWQEAIMRGFTTASDNPVNMTFNNVVYDYRNDDSYRRPNDDWSDEQRAMFGALYLESPAQAYAYAEKANNDINIAKEAEARKKIQDKATSGFWAGAGNTVGAIAATPFGLADTMDDLAKLSAGRPITPDGAISPFEYSQAVTGGIAEHLNTEYGTIGNGVPIIGGKGLGDVYGLGTSIAQSMASAYTLGSAGTLISYFGQGAASGVDEALARGASEGQAVLYGISLGAFEGIAEMLGVDHLFKLGSSSTIKGLLKNILKQAGAEGMEEGITAVLGNIADVFIMQDKSNFSLMLNEYMANGMSESDAKWKVFWDSIEGIAYDTIAGAVSGGVSGGVRTGYLNTANNHYAKKFYGDKAQDIVGDAVASQNSDVKAIGDKYQAKLDHNKKLSGSDLNRLLEVTDTAKVKSAVEAKLTQLGEIGNVSQLAEIITKQAQGFELTRSEKKAISDSKFGQRIVNTLDPKNIRSGRYDTEWSEQIGTRRFNTQEYSRLVNKAAQPDTEMNDAVETADTESEALPKEANTAPMTENATVEETATESVFEASEDAPEIEEENSTVTLEDASQKYGAQAQAMIHTYTEGQDVAEYDNAYSIAYNMGMSGVSLSYAMNSEGTAYLTEKQRELAYEAGKAAADTAAKEQDAKNKSLVNGKTGRKKGAVKGEGVTIEDLKKSFNDTQNTAYKVLTTFAEATGIDIVLYKSEANAEGNFEGAQGRFKWSDDKLYIDINAGLKNVKSVDDLAKYAMIRTFSHEFTHFIEKWNPIWYNEFRKVVFDTLTERGENVHDLIETKMSQSEGMTYDKASREVVAEAMTDILPDSHFVETLANNHKNIFEKLLEKLKEFLSDLKAYFDTIGHNRSREANALKEQVGDAVHYVESIVELFDKVAVEAVENYQATVAIDEVTEKPAKIESTDTIKADKDSQKGGETVKTDKYDHFTITDNAEFGSLEITFDGKPSEAVRDVLKEHKFRWHSKKGVWYGKGERADIVKALQEAYQSEAAAEETETKPAADKTATEILRDMGGKAVSDNMTDVTDLFFPELAKKEEKPNVENVDNGSTVQGTVSDRQGDPQVLEGLQAGDVSGDVQRGDSVGDSVERGQQTVRDDVRPDAAGTRGGSSEGDNQSGDIRRDDELTPEATEKLHEEVSEQIAQQSTEQPKGRNFVIGDSLDLPNGEKARYKANIEAIRLVKKLEAEGRYATEAEQAILSKYVGWGGLADAFDETKDNWKNEF